MKKQYLTTILGPAFSMKQALQVISHDEMRRLHFQRPFSGVRTIDDAGPHLTLTALLDQLPPNTFAARDTAAALHGLPTSFPDDSKGSLRYPCIAVNSSSTRIRRKGVRGCRLSVDSDNDLVMVHGIRATSVARTWLDLSAYLDCAHLQMYTDLALSRGLATLDDFRQQLKAGKSRTGTKARGIVIENAQTHVRSAEESILRSRFRASGLPLPSSHKSIPGLDENWRILIKYVPKMIAVYLSADPHDTTPRALEKSGFQVISITPLDLLRPAFMVNRFRHKLNC